MSVEVTAPAMLDLFRPVHQRIREDLLGLDAAVLNWRPGPETNSVGALIEHIVTTERRNLLRINGLADDRASSELDAARRIRPHGWVKLLDQADAFLDEMGQKMPSSRLSTLVTHPHRGPSTALVLILQTYGHVKEHFGHFELTRQLCLQGFAPTSGTERR